MTDIYEETHVTGLAAKKVLGTRWWERVAAQGSSTCAIEYGTNRVWCWGSGGAVRHQQGAALVHTAAAALPARLLALLPQPPPAGPGPWPMPWHGAPAGAQGELADGKAGDGWKHFVATPQPIPLNAKFSELAMNGNGAACALEQDTEGVWCW